MSDKNTASDSNIKNLLSAVVGSYILVFFGLIAIAVTSKFLSKEPWNTLGFTFGSTIVAAGALGIVFEYLARDSLMEAFTEKVQVVVQKQFDDFRAKSERLRRSGIVDFEIQSREQIEETLFNAREFIFICKTWIPLQDMEYLRRGLERAFAASNDKEKPEVKILCLDPTSPLVAQRYHDSLPRTPEGDAAKEGGQQRITDGLKEIMEFCGVEQRYLRVQVRTYRNVPAVSLYCTENSALIGWYWMSADALDGPALLVEGGAKGSLSEKACKNFNEMWTQSSEYAPEVEDNFFIDASKHISQAPDGLLQELAIPRSPKDLQLLVDQWPGLKNFGRVLMERLSSDSLGYCIVKKFPIVGQDKTVERRNQFLLLTCACGKPTDHRPPREEYICEVAPNPNPGGEVATYSEHDLEALLHTDSHYNDDPENFVGFLMEKKAAHGGRNILLRFDWIKEELQKTEEGRKWFKYFQTDELPSAKPSRYSASRAADPEFVYKHIIFEGGTKIRFREDTIKKAIGHPKSKPYSADEVRKQREALAFLTRLICRSPARRGVTLVDGHLLFVNNHTVLHARTGFKGLDRLLLRIRFNA